VSCFEGSRVQRLLVNDGSEPIAPERRFASDKDVLGPIC